MKQEQLKSITLTYEETFLMGRWIMDALLHGQELRSRAKMIPVLNERLASIEPDRLEIIKKYAELDKKTKEPVLEGNNYKLKDPAGFEKEYHELLNKTTFTFDVLPSNSADWNSLKSIMLNLNKDFNYNDGITYTNICDKLENKSDLVKDIEKKLDK